ncbi:uncharacterized protein [Triticum aestivum]|uniref:uncharacterized protein isoform X1 n=1 Tax=Triticum aestivum TaxID=4565 RepID=UPI001D022C43|nr:uncharacterized protein LOC123103166 isoform X1 [Triticum aestivum]XP_044380598.1 uncharacterized protein LOC123103166 isoform X1 [Triticum aestivum]
MGTPHSKPTEQTTSSPIPPGICSPSQTPSQETECVAGPREGTSVDDSNERIIPVADVVDMMYPCSPGVHITPYERMILQTDGDSTCDTPDQPSSMDLHEKRELMKARRRAAYRKKKEKATVKQQDEKLSALTISDMQNVPMLPLGDITKVCQPTSVDLDEKKELTNARRRAGYRKKKEEAASKQQDENLPAITKSVMLNVPQLPLGDITNVCQPSSMDLDEKKEQIKARRRAAYRKKKEEAASKQLDENQPALTILGAYLSRTFGDGAVDGDLIEINEHLQNADQQTSDPVTKADNGADEQSHESKARRGTRERACKGSMAAKTRQVKIGKQKTCSKVPHGERNALRDRRNERFAGRVMTPTVRSISIPEMSSTGQPTVLEAHGASTPSSTPEYTIRSEDDMDAYLSRLMNDNVNPDILFDDEYYLFAGEGSDVDDMEHDELEDSSQNTYVDHDPLDYVYSNLPDHTHILKHAANCHHCKAKKFVSEAPGFCCRSGQIQLKQPDPIPELMRLWSSMDADSRHFRENIRFFNGHFSFTTLGISLDESYTNMKSGLYTFRAHGTIYHNVHSFGPTSRPDHLQLYFYDDDPGLTHRKAATEQLD